MKKLLLINPVGNRSGFLLSRISTFQPLGLAYIAAVTPSNWEIIIIDENFEPFEFENADLVGITAFTSNINRAYEIAGMYRVRNTKVILGGIHVSMLPDEALQYADAVVLGEAEGIWGQVIADFENDCLLQKYIGPQIRLDEFKITPRRDLLHHGYLWHSVQTSRGCPFDCHFCSVSRYMGKAYRQRSAQNVLNELEGIDGKYITFVDDNLIGHNSESKARAIELFQGMVQRRLQKKWWMQTSINAGTDEQVIKLAAQAGCMFVFIGFETIDEDSLKEMKKGINLKIGVEQYKKIVDSFHKYGIAVIGAFIIGNDHESPNYYKTLAKFLIRSSLDIVQISILTPLPGTHLMDRVQKEGLIVFRDFPQDWDKYRFSYMVHRAQGISADSVYIGNNFIKRHIYSFPIYQYRLLKSLYNLRSINNYFIVHKMNQAFKKSWENAHYSSTYPAIFKSER